MHTLERPYRLRSLDRWVLLVAALLVLLLILVNLSGLGRPAKQAAPALVAPAAEAALLAGQPGEISGTAAPNAQVRVSDGDVSLGETTAGADGQWTLAVPALTPGTHTLTVQVLDANGNVVATSEPLTVTVGEPTSIAARAPEIKLPQGGLQVGEPVELEGTGTPGSTVTLYDGDQPVAETTVAPDGTWKLTIPPLALGAHSLVAKQFGADGKEQAASPPVELTVADGQIVVATPAAVAGATAVPGAGAPAIKLPAAGLKASEPLTLEGTGTPGSTVTVYDGDEVVGETTVGPDGTWTLTLRPLALGAHSLVAKQVGADGKEQAASAPVELTVADGQIVVATVVPTGVPAGAGEPTATAVAGATSPVATTAASATAVAGATPPAPTGMPAATGEPSAVAVTGAATAAATPVGGVPTAVATTTVSVPAVVTPVGGSAEVGAPLTLEGTGVPGSTVKVYDDDVPVGEATVGADGKWKMTLPMLAAGAHSLVAKLFGADGKEQSTSAPLSITVPETPAATLPVIRTPAAGKLTAGAATDLAGTAAPGTLLKLYDGDKLLGEATADANGEWKMAISPLVAGEHILTAIAYGADGAVQASSKPLTVIVPEAQPGAETAAAAQPRIGWPPDGSTVVSSRPLVTGQSFPRGVVRIYDGKTLLGETDADANGFWSFRPSVALTAGQHVLTAEATSADGRTTENSLPVTITVRGRTVTLPSWKPSAAAVPAFVTPTNGDTVDTLQPLFAGTAAANSTVRLYDGDKVLGQATVDSDGRWNFRPPTPFSEGEHTVTVALLNADGTESTSSATVTITVVTGLGTAPAEVPLVIGAVPGTTSNRRPVFTGQAPANATIRVYDGDQLLGEIKAGPDGLWFYVPPSPLTTGKHLLRFEVVGPDGGTVTSVDRPITVAAGATSVAPPEVVVPAQGQVAPGDMLTGTAPAGSQVQVYEGGTLIGGTTAGANGKWRFRLPKNLSGGKHEIHVVVVDQTGLPVSQSVVVTVAVAPPRTLPVTGSILTGN